MEPFKAYLAARSVPTEGRKRVGAVVRLIPTDRLEAVDLDGEPVIPRHDVEHLIRANPATYGDAEELLA